MSSIRPELRPRGSSQATRGGEEVSGWTLIGKEFLSEGEYQSLEALSINLFLLISAFPRGGDSMMGKYIVDLNEREGRRMFVKCMVHYDIGGVSLKGISVNASRKGIMIKTSLRLETALEIFKFLVEEPNHRTVLELTLDGETHMVEAEVKHYHLDSSSNELCLLKIGLGFPKDAKRMRIEA